MAIEAMNAGWRWAGPMRSGPFGVLMALLDHASSKDGGDWIAYPSIERLMAFTKQSDSTVRQNLRVLMDDEFIVQRVRTDKERTRVGGQYEYVIDLERLKADVHPVILEADKRRKPAVIGKQSPPVSGPITAGLRSDHRRTPAPHIEEPFQEPLLEPGATSAHAVRDPSCASGSAGKWIGIPTEKRDQVVAIPQLGEGWAISWLDPCSFDPETGTIHPRSDLARGRIEQDLRPHQRALNMPVGEPRGRAQ